MSFENTAKEIIKSSIISSLYIDDKVIEPFETPKDGDAYFAISKGLYSSFKQYNRSLDFYKFRTRRDWRTDSDYIFKNRDLLILDWELTNVPGSRQKDTLEILKKAVETDNLHFVSIYTETKPTLFPDIFYSIKAYFTEGFNAETKSLCEDFQDKFDELGIDDEYLTKSKGILKNFALNEKKREEIDELKGSLQADLGKDFGTFCKELRKINTNVDKAAEIFGYFINDELQNDSPLDNYNFNFEHMDNNFIVINHTIIKLSNKKDPKPKDFFTDFTKAILKICANPLTLTSLEIKNLIREGSGFIGKDANEINAAALFYHKSSKEDVFFDFILEIWKSHILSFVDNNTDTLKSLKEDFWKTYKSRNKITKKLASLKKDKNSFHEELAKLNTYYNTFYLTKDKSDIAKFGDVFIEVNDEGVPLSNYWLNITAHCDCLCPGENIKNNFYFISGTQKDLKKALKEGDREHNSYLRIENEVVAIGWNNRPVVLNITANKMEDFILKVKDGKLREFKLKYVATLKENYAQRMTNNSFSFAMRVGIDFAGLS